MDNTIPAEIIKQTEETGLDNFINLININPKEIALNIQNQLKEGLLDAIKVKLVLKKLGDINEIFKTDKESENIIIKECRKYGDTFDMYNAKFQVTSVHTTYDYSVCNDPYLTSLIEIEEKIKELKKVRETELKSIVAPAGSIEQAKRIEVINSIPELKWETEQGIEVELYPPIKIQKEGVKITLKK